MSQAEKVGQVTQLDVLSIVASGTHLRLNLTAAAMYAELGVGSFLNSPAAGGPRAGVSSPTADMWRSFLSKLNRVYAKAGKVTLLRSASSFTT